MSASDKDLILSLKAIFQENDANHDGYLDERDIARIYQKQVDKRLTMSQTTSVTEHEYVRNFFTKIAKDYDDRVS